MYRVFASFVIAAMLVFISTIAGMTVFGMHDGMNAMSNPCTSSACSAMHDTQAPGMDCVNHCLATASSFGNVATPLSLAFAAVVFLLVLLSVWPSVETVLQKAWDRWRDGIGKFLLHQNLATVILRD